MKMIIQHVLLSTCIIVTLTLTLTSTVSAFLPSKPLLLMTSSSSADTVNKHAIHLFHKEIEEKDDKADVKTDSSYYDSASHSARRQFLSSMISSSSSAAAAALAASGIIGVNPASSFAEETVGLEATTANAVKIPNTIEMKTFVDPKGLFAINVPKNFFAIRRTVKGDLPDEATGKGRRGSSIFTAGDMAKAEVVAVERFPTRVLLEEEGIISSGDLTTFPSIGDPTAIANLIVIRRDRDKQALSKTTLTPNSVSVSDDGKTLYFRLSQEIDVQKPELLMEQTGVSELVRITLAKATLSSNDGQMMAVFASALNQDYASVDGPALEESVNSFTALDQSNKQ